MSVETVLITGASSGIGLELARCFAADGSRLVLVSRKGAALEELATELRKAHKIQAQVITAIASRELEKAREAALQLNIPRAYGSYEDLLADPDVEAIYNPLPNHLHVPYTIQAIQAGKHVLCEKPLSMKLEEARDLVRLATQAGVKVGGLRLNFTNWR